MRERIRGEEGKGNKCMCGGGVRMHMYTQKTQKHASDTCINVHTTAGYLQTVIACIM